MNLERGAGRAVCVATVAVGVLAGVAGTSGQAGAVASVVAPSVDWAARTCSAERAYVAHPTSARLDVMAVDSFRAPWRSVGRDAWGLYSDVRSGSVKYVRADEGYFRADCPGL